jgi:hypothetical protein
MVSGSWLMVCGSWFVVYGLWFMANGLQFIVHGLWFMACVTASLTAKKMVFRRNLANNWIKILKA